MFQQQQKKTPEPCFTAVGVMVNRLVARNPPRHLSENLKTERCKNVQATSGRLWNLDKGGLRWLTC